MSSLAQRNALYARLEEVLGSEHAGTLMTHMPSETDLATKADLVASTDRTDTQFAAVDARFEQVNARFEQIDARFEQIDARFEQIDARFDRLEAHMVRFDAKLDGFHEALRDQSRTYMLTMTGVMASFAAVVIASGVLN